MNTTETDDSYMDIHEVARLMKASPRHVGNLMRRRQIPYIKLGRLLRFDREQVRLAVAKCTVQARD